MDLGFSSVMRLLELGGGLGLFLYGMRVMSDAIQRRSGPRLQKTLGILTTNRFTGVFTGLTITTAIQSSSATTVLLVSIVNAGLMNLEQAIGVIMGANIGTTFTAWLVSVVGFKFKISALALPAVAIGIPLFFSRAEKRREIAGILIGFGILFLGLGVMKDSVPDIQNNPELLAFLAQFADPSYASILLFVAIGTILTITVQSSSAAMAITLTMAFKGWITFPIAAAIVLGENIGTTVTAYLASLGMNASARRTARAHMLFNLVGVAWILAVFFPFIGGVDRLMPGSVDDPTHLPFHLSAFHTLFNIANTALLIGFVPVIARVVRRWIPDTAEDADAGHLTFVSSQTAEDLESNLISARAELGRMATIVHDMSLWVLNAMQEDADAIRRTKAKMYEFEALTDQINEKIGAFLTACMVSNLSEDQACRIRAKYRIAHELENIGDDCKNITKWLVRRINKGTTFHASGIEQLSEYSGHVLDFLRYNADYLTSDVRDFSLASAREMEKNLNRQRNQLRKLVRQHLIEGGDVRGEMIFMDIVRHLEQIGDSCFNISEEIMALNGELTSGVPTVAHH